MTQFIAHLSCTKVNSTFCAEFILKKEDEEVTSRKYFHTVTEVIDASTDLKEWFTDYIVEPLLNKLENFQEKDSGYSLSNIISLEINVNKYEVGKGPSSFISLPKQILDRKACINVKNNDNACFYWSIVSALYQPINKFNLNRTSSYPNYTTVLNTNSLELPMPLWQIPKFEKMNNISVNVFGLEMNKNGSFETVVLRVTKHKKPRHVNLLLIQDKYFPKDESMIDESEEEEEYNDEDDNNEQYKINYHYCWIKDLSRLLYKEISKKKVKKYICDRCLNYFYSQEDLNDHLTMCENINDCKVMFSTNKIIKFKNFVNKEIVPFVLYADFESILKPLKQLEKIENRHRYQQHEPFSAGYYLKCFHDNSFTYYNSFRGLECITWFANELDKIATVISARLKHVEPLNVNINLEDAINCHICERDFTPTDTIVRDHSHLTGHFRGFSHNACNLNYKNWFVIPVFIHNLMGYDAHMLIRDLSKLYYIKVLPLNKEKYISFTVYHKKTHIQFRFLDSFRFMGFSLEKMVSFLDKEQLENLKAEFKNVSSDNFELLTHKGIFCYDYIENIERLNETQLPNKIQFYSKLNDEEISEEDYAHAQKVWENFNIKDLGEYSDLYLKTDVLLLADCFENFRKMCNRTYNLDPAHYFTLPGYTWDCMLKYTKCQLETLQDVDMLLFIESSIRGGVSQCSNRFSEANNKYMNTYDPSQDSKYILYFDVNNLYGWAQSQYLPYGNFQWIDDHEKLDVTTIPSDSPIGYLLEVDLSYPVELHDLHKDLPFCPEKLAPQNTKLKKLLTTLHNKEKYIIHYENLKQALKHGLVLTKIYRVLSFRQSNWLAPYIQLNANLRAEAKNDFESENFKLMVNANYGKGMENKRKRRALHLVRRYEGRYGAKNLIASPLFHSRVIFDDNLMAIELRQSSIIFDKPIYTGMAVLELSKTCLYDFHYDFMLKQNSVQQCKLLYTDTDSLLYEITCYDAYEQIIKANISKFDTSSYKPDNVYDIPLVNKKIPGLMKDETSGKIILAFVGLRSKQYTYKIFNDNKEISFKKAKGIKRNVVDNKITFDDYLYCLENSVSKTASHRYIRSILHTVFSIEETKIALSPFDNKRHLLENSFDTIPWGHYSIMQ
ncbi:uncharacterized protein LOC126886339 [Diabrotica virgifera virgifera]|uniref:DNA-directed DNA polymerase n=2 Tax=Diabrotica virgifera virgifera TaxID=50390 RepID=A0ABM5KG45_DIAVI|nr:uncharacterized protein LOC126886339 [Diabrotica virgifera virgifera]